MVTTLDAQPPQVVGGRAKPGHDTGGRGAGRALDRMLDHSMWDQGCPPPERSSAAHTCAAVGIGPTAPYPVHFNAAATLA